MYLTFHCPHCDRTTQTTELSSIEQLDCAHCEWDRPFPSEIDFSKDHLDQCLRCGNPDLWRQKDFPQWLGLLFVAIGAIASSIAWLYYKPILALGILMGFALLDMVLYIVMSDVLVCYRCRTKHHHADVSKHDAFDHELGEKYRQEEIKRKESEVDQHDGNDAST